MEKIVWRIGFEVDIIELMSASSALIRISDNVLEPEDWPVILLKLRNSRITDELLLYKGVYSLTHFKGHTIHKLMDWLRQDPTGKHPEIYHEIYIIR